METAATKTLNGRVPERNARKATDVLRRNGITVSDAIRNTMEYIARTGQVPECVRADQPRAVDEQELKRFLHSVEDTPMPGKAEFPHMSAEEAANSIRMSRYGY